MLLRGACVGVRLITGHKRPNTQEKVNSKPSPLSGDFNRWELNFSDGSGCEKRSILALYNSNPIPMALLANN